MTARSPRAIEEDPWVPAYGWTGSMVNANIPWCGLREAHLENFYVSLCSQRTTWPLGWKPNHTIPRRALLYRRSRGPGLSGWACTLTLRSQIHCLRSCTREAIQERLPSLHTLRLCENRIAQLGPVKALIEVSPFRSASRLVKPILAWQPTIRRAIPDVS